MGDDFDNQNADQNSLLNDDKKYKDIGNVKNENKTQFAYTVPDNQSIPLQNNKDLAINKEIVYQQKA